MATQPIQQVPLGQAVAEEGIASSSSLEDEIDRFQFEEKEMQRVEAIVISKAEEETDEYSCIQTTAPISLTCRILQTAKLKKWLQNLAKV